MSRFPSRLPRRPRVAEWVTLQRRPDGGLVISGGDVEHAIPSAEVADLVLDLAPLADGTRTVEELTSAATRLPSAAGILLLERLLDLGVLFEGDLSGAALSSPRRVALEGLTSRPELIDQAWSEARVRVEGTGALATRLREALDGWQIAESSEAPVAIVAADREDDSIFSEMGREFRDRGGRWLRVALDGTSGWVGPIVVPYQTPCEECVRLRRATHRAPRGARVALPTLEPLVRMTAELAASETFRWLTGLAEPGSFGAALRVRLEHPRPERHALLRVPGCSACGRVGREVDPWA